MQKKKIIFLIVIMLLLTGCTRITSNLDDLVNNIFSSDRIIVNTVSTNYELYLPIGVKQEKDREFNQRFKVRNTYIYLYVDTISYYYKNALNYKQSEEYNYYFKKLDFNNKNGYIGINQVEDNLYFAEIVYNYSKVEFYADSDNLPLVLANSLLVIKNIKYNDELIKMNLSDSGGDGRELKYQLDSPKNVEGAFSDYLEEYVPDDDTQEITDLPDET